MTSRALFTFTNQQRLTTLKNYNKIQICKTNYKYMSNNNVYGISIITSDDKLISNTNKVNIKQVML